jgi:DNA-binding HxlR family transcriptional regulator
VSTDNDPPELPVLQLGLLGFSAAQQAIFETALVVLRTRLQWRIVALPDADAICVNGSRTQALPDESLQVMASGPGAASTRLDPNESDRPLSFSLPLGPGVVAASTFDMASPASTRAMLEKFEGWLRPMSVQFCLASRIVQSRLDLSANVYHVTVDGRMVAVVSRRSGIGVLPIADPFHLNKAEWARRPELADEIPGHFVQAGVSQVLWQYTMRTQRNLLPTYFRSGPIYWCRAPQLPQRLFNDSHLMIVRELAHAPLTFADLAKRTGLADAVLSRDLAGLRIVGAVTHDRKQAQRAGAGLGSTRSAGRGPLGDMTAPAPLAPQACLE